MNNPTVCFHRHGFAKDNTHIVTFETLTKEQTKQSGDGPKQDHTEEVIFRPEAKCKPHFLDVNGTKRDKVCIADNTHNNANNLTEWMHFWLIDATADEEKIAEASIDSPERGSINRQRRKSRWPLSSLK